MIVLRASQRHIDVHRSQVHVVDPELAASLQREAVSDELCMPGHIHYHAIAGPLAGIAIGPQLCHLVGDDHTARVRDIHPDSAATAASDSFRAKHRAQLDARSSVGPGNHGLHPRPRQVRLNFRVVRSQHRAVAARENGAAVASQLVIP